MTSGDEGGVVTELSLFKDMKIIKILSNNSKRKRMNNKYSESTFQRLPNATFAFCLVQKELKLRIKRINDCLRIPQTEDRFGYLGIPAIESITKKTKL